MNPIGRLWRDVVDVTSIEALDATAESDLHRVVNDVALSAALLVGHEDARKRATRRLRVTAVAWMVGVVSGMFFLTLAYLLGQAKAPVTNSTAIALLVSLFLVFVSNGVVLAYSLPLKGRRQDNLRLRSAAAAGRASGACVEGVNLTWRRRVGDGIANTAAAFVVLHRKNFLAYASSSHLNVTSRRLAKLCAREIRTLIERALRVMDFAALRDDLWRLHMSVVADDFDGVLRLGYQDAKTQPAVSPIQVTWVQVVVAVPVVLTVLLTLLQLIWGSDSSLLDLMRGDPQAPTPSASPTTGT